MIGTSGLMLFSKHVAGPTRLAIAAGAVAGLVVLAILREVYRGHPSTPELAIDRIGAGE